MTTIAIIPARGGSKGLPRKNIIDFHGKPLIHWTIKAAIDSGCFDSVIVSTDCDEIAAAAERSGATVQPRPDRLATDEARTQDVLLHVLDQTPADTVVVLQPTSPLRTAGDIQRCLEMHREAGKPVVSVSPAKPWLFARSNDAMAPAFSFAERRQDAEFVAPNGAVYVFSADFVRAGADWTNCSVPYLMPVERSSDIDTHTDLAIAKVLFSPRPVSESEETAYRMAL